MIDSCPYDPCPESAAAAEAAEIGAFWTFGPGSSTGTWIFTVLGIALMLVAIGGWVWLENAKLTAQAALLRAAGGMPAPGGIPPGPGPSQEPLAGPSTDPGD